MTGKAVLVTGATGGIGQVAARALAGRGARVTIIGRNPDKTRRVAAEIGAAGYILADLSEQSQVRRAAADYREREGTLDVLLNNAGMIYGQRQESADGTEMTWALDHLAYFLLTQELTPLLSATPGARVVSVSSEAHRFGRIRWDDPEFTRRYSAWAAYGQAKLANLLFTRELARRLAGSGVTANALHPGVVATSFGAGGGLGARLMGLARPLMKTAEQGAQTSIYLAASPEVEGLSGLYFSDEKVKAPAKQGLDDDAAARLWALSERYVNGEHVRP